MTAFFKGVRDGIPIGLGYMAVAFSLGIIARNAGLAPAMGFVSSVLTRASAGEYAVYTLMGAGAAYLEVVAVCFVANLRYLLMGAALSQKFSPVMPLWKRILAACCITDEIFGISVAYKGDLPLSYPLGATILAGTMWGCGTALGIAAGNILPATIVSALSVALYGMFIAIIIPPSKKDKAVMVAVIASFIISFALSRMPFAAKIGPGIKIAILTIIIASAAAVIRPVEPVEPAESTEPVRPEGPVEPVESTEPVQPEGPVEPVESAEPVQPEGPVESAESDESYESVKDEKQKEDRK